MISQVIYEVLEELADKHIPEGRHKLLHVNSKEAWLNIMIDLVQKGVIGKKLSLFKKCAVNWEIVLVQKISIQN